MDSTLTKAEAIKALTMLLNALDKMESDELSVAIIGEALQMAIDCLNKSE